MTNKQISNLKIIGLLVVLVALVVFPKKASASGLSVVISPPSTTLSLQPGDFRQGVMTVTNNSEVTIDLKATVHDFIVKDAKGTPVLVNSSRFSANSWFSLSADAPRLAAHETQNISYYIQVPQDSAPGGHYSAVIFQTDPIKIYKNGTAIAAQLGSLFSLIVEGPVREFARITTFQVPAFLEYGPVEVKSAIQNQSDIHIRPQGAVELHDIFGNTVATSPLTQVNIFPDATREYENKLGGQILLGRYQVKMSAVYGTDNKQIAASSYIWIFPWRLAIVAVLLLTIIVLIAMVIYSRRKPAIHQEESQEVIK